MDIYTSILQKKNEKNLKIQTKNENLKILYSEM